MRKIQKLIIINIIINNNNYYYYHVIIKTVEKYLENDILLGWKYAKLFITHKLKLKRTKDQKFLHFWCMLIYDDQIGEPKFSEIIANV